MIAPPFLILMHNVSFKYTLMKQIRFAIFCVIEICFYILKYCKINEEFIEGCFLGIFALALCHSVYIVTLCLLFAILSHS